MKDRIVAGLITPKTQNYQTHRQLTFFFNKKPRKCRSLWEVLWWALHPKMEYEVLRLSYEIDDEQHIYIVDFVDQETMTVYELKPSKYQSGAVFAAKDFALRKWCVAHAMTLVYVDETYFKELGRHAMIDIIMRLDMPEIDKQIAINRCRWYKNEGC